MIQGLTKSRLALALTLALGASSMAYAADTTSAIRGTIVGPNGQPAPHTKIMLLHEPSGTVTEVETNDSGSFSASGLRVGGPYRIIIDSDQYQDMTKDGIFLQLGKTLRFNQQLTDGSDVERITVVGSKVALSSNAGASSVFGADAIENTPSFNRDIKDVVRSNPLVNTLGGDDNPMTIAGSNPRFNSITVDGVAMNDDFGLNSNGYPTQGSPIPMDALEQVSVEVAPFDAKENGFSGGHINTVTKSGTNEFHGNLRYETSDEDWAGKAKSPFDHEEYDVPGVDKDTYAATLGGPIIKDKLFFFAAYEKSKEPVANNYGPSDAGVANPANITSAELARVRQAAQEVYGVDPGTYGASGDEELEKYLAKIDWNVTDRQRLAFTYMKTKSNQMRGLGGSDDALTLSSQFYNNTQDMDTYTLKLFSDWTDDFSTEASVSYKKVDTGRHPGSMAMGEITLNNFEGDDEHGVTFGPDTASHANELQTKTWTANLDATYLLGDHQIEFGVQYQKLDIFNLYVNGSKGAWEFDDLDAFIAGRAYDFSYTNAYTNDPNDSAAEYTTGSYAGYIQDKWALTPDVEVQYGVRYERIFTDDKPTFNQNFYDRHGFSNQENLDGVDIWLPRLNIDWYATDDLTLHAGVGRFSGGTPNVWISNSYSRDGVTTVSIPRTRNQYFDDITSVPQGYQDELVSGNGETDAIDPDFKIPSEWRANIGFDYNLDIPYLGDDWLWSTSFMYVRKEDSLSWTDLNRYDSGERATDGRVVYNNVEGGEQQPDIYLTNSNRHGRSKIITTSLSKDWDSGVSLTMSYTHQDVTEGNFGDSSQARSNYAYNHVINRNQDQIGRAYYEVEHSFKINLGYKHEFFEGYATRFNAYFERHSGMPYSWLMGGEYNLPDGQCCDDFYALGDQNGIYGYYAPYIPTGPNDPAVSYEDGFSYEQFMDDYVRPAGLEGYAGGYVPKMTGHTPWVSRMDVSITQEIPGLMEGHKGEVYVMVQNFLNLLDKNWGRQEEVSYSYKNLINAHYSDGDDHQLVYHPVRNWEHSTQNDFDDEQSVWYIKVGVNYTF